MPTRIAFIVILALLCKAESNTGVIPPSLVEKVAPLYSDEATRAHLSGSVLLSLVVDQKGVPQNIKVARPLGYGLDQKAIEAVMQWRFKPGMRGGVPIAVMATVEVSFRLTDAPNPNPPAPNAETARAQFNVAIHQLRGDAGYPKDEKAAFQTMQQAAALSFAPAQSRLGDFYNIGIGTEVDHVKAVEWFDRAAYQGDAEGEFQLGVANLNGMGVARDSKLARDLLTRAAQQDHMEAEYALGLLSETGEADTPKDLHEALKWYQKSAEQGFPNAEDHLARLYWSGDAGEKDEVKALTWALLAEKGGLAQAAPDVAQYRAALPAKRVAEAETAAEKFKPRAANGKPAKN